MLYKLGRGLSGYKTVLATTNTQRTNFNFTTAMPSDFTCVRSNAGSTARNISGNWVSFPANTPRIDHDASGNPLGMRIEPPNINLVNHYNFAPTTIGGITVRTGDGVASIIADASVSGATIDGSTFTDLQNGNAIALTGGTGGTTYRISSQAGIVDNFSYQLALAGQGTGYHGNIKDSWAKGLTNFNGTNGSWVEILKENFEVGGASAVLEIFVTTGNTIHIIGVQFEQNSTVSYPIVTTGSTGLTTGREYIHSDLSSMIWWNNKAGAMAGEFVFDKLEGAEQYAMIASTNGGLTNAVGMYLTGNSNQVKPRDIIAGSNQQNNDIHRPISGRRMPVGIAWKDDTSLATAGGMTFQERTYTGTHANMDDLYLGSRPFGSTMSGWIKSLTVWDDYVGLNEMATAMFPAAGSYRAIMSSGQSNAHGNHRATDGQGNAGETAAVTQMDAVWTTTENWLLDCAVDGAALIEANNAVNYYTATGGADGTSMIRAKTIATAFGISNIDAIIWDQGASDRGDTEAVIKANTETVFNNLRLYIGSIPIITAPIGVRADQIADSYNKVKRVQEDIATEQSWAYLSPPQNNVTFGSDNIHFSDAAYGAEMVTQARKALAVIGETISGTIDPPTVASASRAGVVITVTMILPTGITAITPTSAIAGFRFFDDGTEINITTSTYSGGDITLTLASTPTGVETLYFGYGSMFIEIANIDNFPVGDDNNTLGVQNMVVTL